MADTGIYCTTAEVGYKAGLGKSTTSSSEAYVNSYVAQAESEINVSARKIFATDTASFATLPATTRNLLKEAATNLAAIYVINYDMAGFPSRIVAEDMINVLRDGYLRTINILKEEKANEFLVSGVR
jgi:hypothetical protein